MCGKKHKMKMKWKKGKKVSKVAGKLKEVNFLGKPKAVVGKYASKKDVLKY